MDIYECSSCGEAATRQTIVDDVYVCDDIDCILTLAEEHFVDNSVDLEVINNNMSEDEDYFNND